MNSLFDAFFVFLLDPENCFSFVFGCIITLYGMAGLARFYAYIPQIKRENDTMTSFDMKQYFLWLLGLILLFGYTISVTQHLWLVWIFA